jgi:hypothetical protein
MNLVLWFNRIINNRLSIFLIGIGIIIGVLYLVLKKGITMPYKVWYFSEDDRIVEQLPVKELDDVYVKTTNGFEFVRNSLSYTLQQGRRMIQIFLAKRGTAYTFRPRYNKEGELEATIIGNLYEGVKSCLGETLAKEFTDEAKEKLMNSNIFVTVELESGTTPKGLKPRDERGVNTAANKNMANLLSFSIATDLKAEDWIRNVGLIAVGAVIIVLADAIGIIAL